MPAKKKKAVSATADAAPATLKKPRRQTKKRVQAVRAVTQAPVQKTPRRTFPYGGQLLTQLSIAGIAIAILLFLGIIDPATFATLRGKAEVTPVAAQIGLEYGAPTTLEMLFARKGASGYLSVSNPSDGPVKISVPEVWSRTEVRGAPIIEFASEPPQFGFRRWTMPARSGMSMMLPQAPTTVLFMSPSPVTAGITLRSVDVLTGDQFINVVLLNKEVETALWQE